MRRRSGPVLVLVAIASLCSMVVAQPIAGAADLLPDLKMAPIYDLSLQHVSSGKIRLRFGSTVWNIGQGPLEARGTHRVRRRMTQIRQRIYASDGTTRSVTPPGVTGFYAGDGHDHWHLSDFVLTTLFPIIATPSPSPSASPAPSPSTSPAPSPSTSPAPSPTASPEMRRLRKVGFCLVDSVRAPADVRPPNSAAVRAYPVRGCGTRTSQRFKMGISVGWADVYPASIAHQWINVTGLAAGDYRLCSTSNPAGAWQEMSLANNSAWIDLHINLAADQLIVLGQGEAECQPAQAAAGSALAPTAWL